MTCGFWNRASSQPAASSTPRPAASMGKGAALTGPGVRAPGGGGGAAGRRSSRAVFRSAASLPTSGVHSCEDTRRPRPAPTRTSPHPSPASLITLRRLHAEQVSGRSDCSLPLYGLLAVLSASHVAHSMPGRKKKVVFAVIRACPSGSAEEPGDERGRCSTCGVVLAGLREGGQQGALPRPGAGKNGPPGKGQTETHTCCARALSRGTSRQDLRMSTTAAWKGCDSSREDGKKEVSAESGQEGAGWGPDKCERESRQQMTFSGAWKGAAAPEKPPQTAHRLLRRPTGEGRFHEVPEGGQSRWQGDLACGAQSAHL